MSQCACGSAKEYTNCCGPYITGKKNAPTAEALMRSRYSAFANGELDYVQKTHHPDTRSELDMEGVKSWALNSEWLGLEILEKEAGAENDSEGKVEFRCRFHFNGSEQTHHELSTFRKKPNKKTLKKFTMKNKNFYNKNK